MPPRVKAGEAGAGPSSGVREQLQIFNPGPAPPSHRLREAPTSRWARTKSFGYLPKSLVYLVLVVTFSQHSWVFKKEMLSL